MVVVSYKSVEWFGPGWATQANIYITVKITFYFLIFPKLHMFLIWLGYSWNILHFCFQLIYCTSCFTVVSWMIHSSLSEGCFFLLHLTYIIYSCIIHTSVWFHLLLPHLHKDRKIQICSFHPLSLLPMEKEFFKILWHN